MSDAEELKLCTKCGKRETRENIVVMKVAFHRLGASSTQERSRNAAWLCPECCGSSDEWNIPERSKTKVSGSEVNCDGCHGFFDRSQVMVSKVIFYPLINAAWTMRSRTRSWLCAKTLPDGSLDPSSCLSRDEIWSLEGYRSSPGWRETEEVEEGA